MNAFEKPFVYKEDGNWRIRNIFGNSPRLYDTWQEAYTHALRYA